MTMKIKSLCCEIKDKSVICSHPGSGRSVSMGKPFLRGQEGSELSQ